MREKSTQCGLLSKSDDIYEPCRSQPRFLRIEPNRQWSPRVYGSHEMYGYDVMVMITMMRWWCKFNKGGWLVVLTFQRLTLPSRWWSSCRLVGPLRRSTDRNPWMQNRIASALHHQGMLLCCFCWYCCAVGKSLSTIVSKSMISSVYQQKAGDYSLPSMFWWREGFHFQEQGWHYLTNKSGNQLIIRWLMDGRLGEPPK